MISNLLAPYHLVALAILRLTTGFMFFQHGLQKAGYLEGRVSAFPELTWFAMVLELTGGVLVMLGLFTRPVAFLLSGQMAVAYFTWVPRGFWPILNGGERAYLFCFVFLFLVAAGPGRWSLDGWLGRNRSARWWM
jgi:putative oxidoreductase